jgi:hypothetical protein
LDSFSGKIRLAVSLVFPANKIVVSTKIKAKNKLKIPQTKLYKAGKIKESINRNTIIPITI